MLYGGTYQQYFQSSISDISVLILLTSDLSIQLVRACNFFIAQALQIKYDITVTSNAPDVTITNPSWLELKVCNLSLIDKC